MKVREATIMGLMMGLIFGLGSFEYNALIGFFNWGFGISSIIVGKKLVTLGRMVERLGIWYFWRKFTSASELADSHSVR